MAQLQVQLVTPERTVITETVSSLTCPTTEGYITILPGHTPLIAALVSGELVAKNGDIENNIHVAGGFVQVKPGSEVVILADTAEHFYEIDLARAEEAKKLAEQTLKEQNLSDEEYVTTSALLQRNLSRIRIARKHAHRRSHGGVTSQSVFHE
jgi:F-type H+-transporting ATPase subunit epsilon